jgi:hypothetical protein
MKAGVFFAFSSQRAQHTPAILTVKSHPLRLARLKALAYNDDNHIFWGD